VVILSKKFVHLFFLCLRVFVANFVFCPLPISFQSQEVQKKCSKTVNFLQFLLKTRSFLQKNAKKCKFLLIFTPIFTLKTNQSYKSTLFTIASHPNFQNSPQNPLFS